MAASRKKKPADHPADQPAEAPHLSQPTVNASEDQLRRLEDLVGNAAATRMSFLRDLMDPRRDAYVECGYPKTISPQFYQELFERNSYAQRAVEVMVKEACQTKFIVYENEDETDTPFEADLKEVNKQLRGPASWFCQEEGNLIADLVEEAAIKAGIGHYGIIIGGLNDGQDLSKPVPGVEEKFSMPARMPGDDQAGPTMNWKDPYSDTLKFTTNSCGGAVPPAPTGIYSMSINKEARDYVLTTTAARKITKAKGKRELTYLRAFSEAHAVVTRWESNRTSPRYGLPVSYMVRLDAGTGGDWWSSTAGQPTNTVDVHWTRVVHITGSGPKLSRVASQPIMLPILNRLLDIDKVFGAAGEGYWKSCFTGLSLETHPQLGPNVRVDRANLKDQIENYENGLQRVLYLMGMQAKTLAPSVVDPTSHIAGNVKAIATKLGVPVPVFEGYEIGEQASENNDLTHQDRVRKFQRTYMIPSVIAPLYDWLIMVGVLSEPGEEGYKISFEELDRQSAAEKANIANTVTSAMATYVSSGLNALVTEEDFLVGILQMDEEEVQAWLERAATQMEEQMATKQIEDQQLAEEQGMVPSPPEGYEWDDPPPAEPNPIKLREGEKLVTPKKNPGGKFAFSANGDGGEQ